MTTGTKERAGIWIRVSSSGQNEANQIPDCTKYCDGRGYEVVPGPDGNPTDLNGVPVRYVSHAKSASKGKQQPALDQVMADIRAGIIQVLVIWHSDRLERREGKPHTSPLMGVLAEVAAAGGRVESVQESQLGQLDMGSQTMTFMAGLINAEKSKHLAEQGRIAQGTVKTNGGLWGQHGWGFDITGPKYAKKLVPNADGKEYAPGIFQQVADGQSLAKVAAWMESETGPAMVG